MLEKKPRMLSAVKPTGRVTLGNWLGAIRQFVKYQEDYELYIFIANLHALTLPISKKDLKENTENLLAIYLAAGLDPNKAVIFKQSDVPAHTQLEWVLTCNTDLSDFTKMPQYKNYCANHQKQATPAGMLLYPSLMNADILLFDTDYVPVGIDQKPHVDLARDVASSFNKIYPDSFKLPEAIVPETGAKIMSLTNPTKKMSKSESDAGTIYLLEDVEISKKKIMKAVTDSDNLVKYDPENKPGVSNLMTILSCLTGESFDSIEARYSTLKYPYGPFKKEIAETLGNELSKIQAKVAEIKASGKLAAILAAGAKAANDIANKKIQKIYSEIGLN